MLRKFLKILIHVNYNTIVFNFKYLPFRTALLFPIIVSRHVYLKKYKGQIIFKCPIHSGIVKLGYSRVSIFDEKQSRAIWFVSGTVIFNGPCDIGQGAKIGVGPEGILEFGEKFQLTAESTILCTTSVKTGTNVMISWETLIMDDDLHNIYDVDGNIINQSSPIIIGNNVWIGCRCLILKGTEIPSETIVAANSLISKKMDGQRQIIGGNPCHLLKTDVYWK